MIRLSKFKAVIITTLLTVILGISLPACAVSNTAPPSANGPSGTAAYPNGALLVDTAWLRSHADDTGLIIIDARADKDYSAGHIRNSINLAPGLLDDKVGDDTTVLKSPNDLSDIFGKNGVSNTAKIIVYGGSVDPNAGRVFWALEYLGHKDVHILDGGYTKWTADGNPVTKEKIVKPATTFTAATNTGVIATKADEVSSLNNDNVVRVDSRNAVDWVAKKIPGSVNILWGDFLNTDGAVKSSGDLSSLLSSKGVTPGKTIIANCYVGYRSSQGYFIFRLMGYNASNYDGSTTEWFADASLPTEP